MAGPAGWGGVDLHDLARTNHVPVDDVRILGRVSDEQLGALLRGARALVAPSRSEGFGLPVAEAMAAGAAVICSDIPALAEVAGGAARLVPADDPDALATAVAAVCADDELHARLVAAGRAQAPKHSWDAVALRAWTLYRSLLS